VGKTACLGARFFPGEACATSKCKVKILLVAMVCASALAGSPRAAHGATPRVTVVTASGAQMPPAIAEELRRATQSRVDGLDAAPAVITITLDDTGATIDVDGKRRRVAVTAWADAAAARTVVVHVVDLATPAPVVAALVEEPVVRAAPLARPASSPALDVFVATRFAHGVGATDPSSPGVEVGTTIYRRGLAFGASLGWTRGLEEGTSTPARASYDTWPLRLAVGLRRGPIEVRASGVVAAYRFAGVSQQSGALWGAGLAVRCRGHLGDGIGWFFEAGADAFAERVQLELVGQVVYSTPRLAPFLGLGLRWELP